MAFKVFRDQTVLRVDDTAGESNSQFFNPSQSRYFIFNNDFIIQDSITGYRLNLGTFDNIRKGDNSTPSDMNDAVNYLNSFVNFSVGSASIIPSNLIFADTATRDAYFNPSRLSELTTGLEIILEDDGSGNRIIQRWLGDSNPDTVDYSSSFWHTAGGDVLTGAEVVALINSESNVNLVNDQQAIILSRLSVEPSGDIRSSVSFIFPPGSVYVGDSVIESGGRMISARSASTGNLGAFLIQLFNDTKYSKATVYDDTQTASVFDIQISDDTVNSGIGELNFRQVVQNNVQTVKIMFRPNGNLPSSFNFQVRLTENGEPVYNEEVEPADLTEIESGTYELTFGNPAQFDSGGSVYLRISGLDIKGGIGFDGTDGVRFGDSTNNNFFPWLRSVSIPINRLSIATENFVNDHSNLFTDDERTKLAGIEEGATADQSASEIKESLETLTDEDRLDASAVKNLPTPIPSRTDEEIQDIIGAMVTGNVETGIVVSYNNGLGKLNFVVTGNGGGTPPPANADIIYYGLSATNNPATVDVSTLTTEENPTNPDMVSTGVTTGGEYFIILVPMDDDLLTIFDTVLNQDVTDIFDDTDNIRTLNSESYKSYVIGQLNANVDEQYVINF